MRERYFDHWKLNSLCWQKFLALDLPIDFQFKYSDKIPNISCKQTIYTRQGFEYEDLSNSLIKGLHQLVDYVKPEDGKYLLMYKLINSKETDANRFFYARFQPNGGKYWKKVEAVVTIKAIFDTVTTFEGKGFDIIL